MSATNTTTLDLNHPCFGNANVLLGVNEVGFETAIKNILQAEGIYYIGQLIGFSEQDFGRRLIANIGAKRRNEIREVVQNLGLQLGVEGMHDCDTLDKLKNFYGVQEISPLYMTVALPKDLVGGQSYKSVVEKVSYSCQAAFNLAVQNKLDEFSPDHISLVSTMDFFKRLNPSITSIQINTGKKTTSFRVPLIAPFHGAVTYKPEFLNQVAEKIGGEFLHSLLAPKLQG